MWKIWLVIWNAKETQMFNKYFCSVLAWKTDDRTIFQHGNKILPVPMQAWECERRAPPVKQPEICSSGWTCIQQLVRVIFQSVSLVWRFQTPGRMLTHRVLVVWLFCEWGQPRLLQTVGSALVPDTGMAKLRIKRDSTVTNATWQRLVENVF